MKIEHVAFWARDLEGLRRFYERYFGAKSNSRYENPSKGFSSYFLTFASGARIELMHSTALAVKPMPDFQTFGLAHIALSLGKKADVDQLTQELQADGYTLLGEPRTTGDGYYESIVLDPEGNRLELTV